MPNKDTDIYCSFSSNPSNFGCNYFNEKFRQYNINAIYKPFRIEKLKPAINAIKCLGIKGFALSMPFKQEILSYVDVLDKDVSKIGSANTVLNKDEKLIAYNTDWLAASKFLEECKNTLYILGNGGYSKAVQYAAQQLNLSYSLIIRDNWDVIAKLRNSTIFNCTPIENVQFHSSNKYIDCINYTETGKKLSLIQASHQFRLYTGLTDNVN